MRIAPLALSLALAGSGLFLPHAALAAESLAPGTRAYGTRGTTDLRLRLGFHGMERKVPTPLGNTHTYTLTSRELEAELGWFVLDGVQLAFSAGQARLHRDFPAFDETERRMQLGMHVRRVWGGPVPVPPGSGITRPVRFHTGAHLFVGPEEPRVAASVGVVWLAAGHFGWDLAVRAGPRYLHRNSSGSDLDLELGVSLSLFYYDAGRHEPPPPEPSKTRVGEVVR